MFDQALNRLETLGDSVAALLHRGRFLDGALRDGRVTRDEVMAALRSSGVADAAGVAAVVLETDGSLNVARDAPPPPGAGASTLEGVAGRKG